MLHFIQTFVIHVCSPFEQRVFFCFFVCNTYDGFLGIDGTPVCC